MIRFVKTASNWDTSCRLAPVTTNDSGAPRSSTRTWRLLPFFPPVRRIRACRLKCHGCFDHRTVDTLPLPCNPFHLVIFGESSAPQREKKTGSHPASKISMYRARTPKSLFRQSLPLTASAQDVDDPLKYAARCKRFPAASFLAPVCFRTVTLLLRDQRCYTLPERIRYLPSCYPFCHKLTFLTVMLIYGTDLYQL
jgi:hypothetical protein